jgi:hypothetical protein
MWIASVRARSKEEWFTGGRWGVAWNTASGVQRHETPGRAILGLFADAKTGDLFALGNDELVLRFDSKDWVQEHVGPKPKRKGRGADIVYSGLRADVAGASRVLAWGPWLVLVRQPDGTWVLPPEPDRQNLSDLGQGGPSFDLPPGCAKAGWFSVGGGRGLFDCHDGRSFLYDNGKVFPKGKLPRDCTKAFDGVAYGQGEVFAACGAGKLWKTTGDVWRLFATFKGEKEIAALAVTDECVFVGGRQTVWRTCTPSNK